MKANTMVAVLGVAGLVVGAVLLAGEACGTVRDFATFQRYSGPQATSSGAAGTSNASSGQGSPKSAFETVGAVAGHGGGGELVTRSADAAQTYTNAAIANTGTGGEFKRAWAAQGGGKLSSKNGSLGRARAEWSSKAPNATNVQAGSTATKWLGRAATAIDIVSPASRIAGHIYEGDWSGAGFAAGDEGTKKWATTKGAAGGAALGGLAGPATAFAGGVAGAAVAEEMHNTYVSPQWDAAAQNAKDKESRDRLWGPRMTNRVLPRHIGHTSQIRSGRGTSRSTSSRTPRCVCR